MWTYPKCHRNLEDAFDACWNCGTSSTGDGNPDLTREAVGVAVDEQSGNLACLCCGGEMDRIGEKTLHEGTNWGVLGELGELFVRRQAFEMYACSVCGHVEFFLPRPSGESDGNDDR